MKTTNGAKELLVKLNDVTCSSRLYLSPACIIRLTALHDRHGTLFDEFVAPVATLMSPKVRRSV